MDFACLQIALALIAERRFNLKTVDAFLPCRLKQLVFRSYDQASDGLLEALAQQHTLERT